MRAYTQLPPGHKEIFSIDMKKDKKAALMMNLGAFLIAVAMVVITGLFTPMSKLYCEGAVPSYVKFIVIPVAYIAYILLHELVHGIAMKLCGTKKVKYGITPLYAYAGSDDCYDKGAYIFIALAPVVLWGAVLCAVAFSVPDDWFWVVWFVQAGNVSGAVGDFYVTVKFSRMPRDILVRDYGYGMKVYSATGN